MSTPRDQIKAAREQLSEPDVGKSPLSALAAASLAACAAVLLAGVMILGPGVAIDDAAPVASQTF